MKFRVPGNSVTATLLIAGALLLALVAIELLLANGSGTDQLLAPQQGDGQLQATTTSVHVPPPIDNYAGILARPLFFADRKLPPDPVQVTNPTAAVVQPLRLKLEGIAITSDSRVAVLRNLANNQLLQLAEGMMHNGWHLVAVSPGSATFKRGTQESKLLLDVKQ